MSFPCGQVGRRLFLLLVGIAAMAGSEDPEELAASLLVKGEENEKMGIDEMLERYAGELGPWQLRHFVLTNLAWVLEAFHTMIIIFSDKEPAWQCTSGASVCTGASSVCGLPAGSWEWVKGRGASTVSEWGLVCGEKYKIGLVQSAFFVGCMIGSGVFGHLADSFMGRRGCLVAVCIMSFLLGCLTALSRAYWFYLFLRLLSGFSIGGIGLSAFILSTEPVGPSKRGAAGMSTFYFFSCGIAMLAAIAYAFQSSWRHLYLATSLPTLLFLVFAVPFIYESPRWYLVRGKASEALHVMHSIAKTNGKKLPEGVTLALDNCNADSGKGEEQEAVSGSLVDVARSPVTRMRLIMSVAINFLTSVVYYGLSLNVVNLGTNLYLNVALNGIAEMPAFTLTAILIESFGRKPLTIATMWFSGLFCLIGSLLGGEGVYKVLRMACGVLGIFGMAGTYNLLFVYTAELFPTVVRNAALGCTTQAGQMGAILAPLVVVLGGGLPFAVFGICGVIGGLLAFYLPETMNSRLYDTMAGIEEGEATCGR